MQDWETFEFSASDGLQLSGRKYNWNNLEAVKNKPVVCLPGLFKNASEFHELSLGLRASLKKPTRILALDYRGRGLSEFDKTFSNYNIDQECSDLIDALTVCGIEHANFVASSRGGMILFNLTGARPGAISSVVLNDVGPEIEAQSMVRMKNNSRNMGSFLDWKSTAQYLAATGKTQFPNFSNQDWIAQAKQLFKEQDGQVVCNYDAALIKTLDAIDLDTRLPDMWPQFCALKNTPTLLVHGANSDFLNAKTITRMRKEHKKLQVLNVPNQGHTPDLSSKLFIQKISEFLNNL